MAGPNKTPKLPMSARTWVNYFTRKGNRVEQYWGKGKRASA